MLFLVCVAESLMPCALIFTKTVL